MFSYLSYAKNDIRSIPADYILESLSDTGGTYYNEASKGLTESERQDINDLPYVASTTGEKKASAMIEVDEINDFVRVINSERYEYSGDHAPTSVDEFASNVRYGDAEENYYNNLEFLNINSEVITTKIYGYDDEQLADLENASIDGKIDFDKLNSGEEVILVAPKKAELSANFGNSCWGYRVTYDENVGKYDAGYKSVLVADCPYKVGDEITIDVATVTYDENTDEINSTNVTQKTVKVGAIVSINDVDDNDEFYLTDFCVLTNLQGINNFISNLDYITLNVTTNCDLDDEMDESITEDLKVYTNKYQGLLDSNYSYNTWQINNYRSFLITMISIIVICFAICISIVNNTISARIRENKKVIGTLRAVGASESDLVKSYIRQMLSMFSLGIVVGYGIFVVMYFAVWYIIKYHLLLTFVFVFNPWITIAMTGLMFVICSLNLWAKVRKEMKNSIVENIQEL
jgi:ABC-type antimicrobial peptide transport system permease subunit